MLHVYSGSLQYDVVHEKKQHIDFFGAAIFNLLRNPEITWLWVDSQQMLGMVYCDKFSITRSLQPQNQKRQQRTKSRHFE